MKFYYPNAISYGDITKTDFKCWRGKIDVLSAGFPCQPFSLSGARKGTEDNRYLWPSVFRAIGEIKPRWFIGENVTGILSVVFPGDATKVGMYKDLFGETYEVYEKYEQFVFERICTDIESIGYTVQTMVIPACGIGAPHRRDRVWFIAYCSDARTEKMPEGENGIYESKLTSDSVCFGSGKICCDLQPTKPNGTILNSFGNEGVTSDTSKSRFSQWLTDSGEKDQEEIESRVELESERLGCKSNTTNTYGINGDFTGHDTSKISGEKSTSLFNVLPDWNDFPAESPLCNCNDGISKELFTIPFSKWRREAIKSLGNSVVPQLVIEIYKAIELIDSTELNV